MQPLVNLKSFLAVLLILIVPGALLVAYFHNYSPGAGGHEHSEMGKDDGAARGKEGGGSMQPGQGAPAAAGMGDMGGGASPPGVDAGMTARLDKMIDMMDRTVRMMNRTVGMMDRMTGGTGGGAPAAGTPKARGMMDDDQMEMGGGSMQPSQGPNRWKQPRN